MNVINYIPAVGYVSYGLVVHTKHNTKTYNIIKSFCSVFGRQTYEKGKQKRNNQYYYKIMKNNNQWSSSPTLINTYKTQFGKKNFKTLGFKNENDLPVTVEQMNAVSPSSSVCLHNQNPGGSQSIISSTLHCDLSLVSTLDESVFWE